MRLGEILVYSGWLEESKLRAALLRQKHLNIPLGKVLVDFQFLPEETIVRALGIQLDIDVIDLETTPVPHMTVLRLLTQAECEAMECAVLAVQGRVCDVAMCDPREANVVKIRQKLQRDVKPLLVGVNGLRAFWKRCAEAPTVLTEL